MYQPVKDGKQRHVKAGFFFLFFFYTKSAFPWSDKSTQKLPLLYMREAALQYNTECPRESAKVKKNIFGT